MGARPTQAKLSTVRTRRIAMNELFRFVKNFIKDEDGATAVEYGVLIALIIAACVVVIEVMGKKLNNAFEKVNTKIPAS
jgi:pilus assembly protein Flp/PilA